MPKQFLAIDYETRSEADIKICGAYEYSMHPSTEILCVAWAIGTKAELKKAPIKSWSPFFTGNFGELYEALKDPSVQLIAHNAFFEQVITRNVLGRKYHGLGEIPHHRWTCTAARAAALALPRHLAEACQVLGLPVQKDMVGHKLMLKLSKPRRATLKDDSPWHEKPEDLKRLIEYCEVDVAAETQLFLSTPPLNSFERKVWELDQKINFKGVRVDTELVDCTLGLIEQEISALTEETNELTRGEVTALTQRNKLWKYLNKLGANLPDLTAKTVHDKLLEKDLSPEVRRLLEMRQAAGKTSTAKYEAFAQRSGSDGRVRDNLLYHGASTGRWSGRGVQLQNVPRGSIKNTGQSIELVKEGCLETLRLLYGSPMDVFASNVRGCLLPTEHHAFFCGDYSSIEVRVLFWLADHKAGLVSYTENRDLYREMATKIYNRELKDIVSAQREVGKRAVLGCGYGMGSKKFAETCKLFGMEVSDELAKTAVDAYREMHAPVPTLWEAVQSAAISAVEFPGARFKAGRCHWHCEKNFLWAQLPSGRKLAYYKPTIKWKATPWGEKRKTLYHESQNSLTHQWEDGGTYGGRLVENITQAVARDIMAEAMIRLDAARFEVVLSVHDELLAEGGLLVDVKMFEQLMATPPVWANGLPIKVDAWSGKRYRK